MKPFNLAATVAGTGALIAVMLAASAPPSALAFPTSGHGVDREIRSAGAEGDGEEPADDGGGGGELVDDPDSLFDFAEEEESDEIAVDVEHPDDLDPEQPVDIPEEAVDVDMSDYERDSDGGSADVGDVDADAAADPGESEAEQYDGPAAAGALEPKVRKIGKAYVWTYNNLALRSLKPFGLVRDVWGGARPNVNRAWLADPKNRRKVVLGVRYPKGTSTPTSKWNPRNRKGGTGFFAAPIPHQILAKAKYVTFQFDVFFPSNFDFVRGGKLPGLWGGDGSKLGCSGGSSAAECFSLRFMFRSGGSGEEYLYVPKRAKQPRDFCKIRPVTVCDPEYGSSVGRGSFSFRRGGWTTVKQLIKLNDPGRQNGIVKVWANGKLAISYGKLVWRTDPKVHVRGIAVETFFGGSTRSHVAKKDERAYFRNFQMVAVL